MRRMVRKHSPVTDGMPTELRQLRHVIAVADHGNFARAAEALRMSQPALSRSVQAVERELGGHLFQRTSSGTEPTDLGHLFVLRARHILQLSEELGLEMANNSSLRTGHVAVGGGPYPMQTTLPQALTRFVAAHPDVSVRLIVREWDELLRRLRGREIELFVAETSTIEHESDLSIEAVSPHPLFLVARAGHPLAGRDALDLSDLFEYPLAAMTRIPPRVLEPIRAAQRRAANPAAVTRRFPAIECNIHSVLTQVVLETDVIMTSTLPRIRAELDSGQLTLIKSEPWLLTRYGIVTLRNHPLSTASARFRELILEAERGFCGEEEALLARWQPGADRLSSSSTREGHVPGGGRISVKPRTKRPAAGL
jgi:DNA-binding transcriptional LysR family regulator